MELVKLENICAGYEGKKILGNVNLTINEGDFIGIIGPNGGGKTTLLKVIIGALKPFSGQIKKATSTENLFGYLPQNQKFDKKFPITVAEVVLSGLMQKKGLFARYTNNEKERVDNLLEQYGLLEYKDRAIGDLSGGQAQRVLLCRAIISNPKILVLDEPTTYIDANFEKEFYSLLNKLNKEMAIVMVSHDIGTICSYVKSIACVNRGLHYHNSNIITNEDLQAYNCPIELVSHGNIPHRVLHNHNAPHHHNCGCETHNHK